MWFNISSSIAAWACSFLFFSFKYLLNFLYPVFILFYAVFIYFVLLFIFGREIHWSYFSFVMKEWLPLVSDVNILSDQLAFSSFSLECETIRFCAPLCDLASTEWQRARSTCSCSETRTVRCTELSPGIWRREETGRGYRRNRRASTWCLGTGTGYHGISSVMEDVSIYLLSLPLRVHVLSLTAIVFSFIRKTVACTCRPNQTES